MNPLTRISGICPAVFCLYTDETCRQIDEEAYRAHVRMLVQHDLGALVVGGHAGEIVCLRPEERARLIQICREEAQGRIPVVGGVAADCTADAVQQGKDALEAGADAVLFTPPSIPGWSSATGAEFLVRHYSAFEDAVGIPIVIFAAPSDRYGTQYFLTPDTLGKLVKSVESIVACKITSQWDVGGFMRCMRAMKEVRDIGCLKAGGQAQYATYSYGADGSLSGGTNFAPADDVEVLRLVQAGRHDEAKAISDSWMPVWDAIYGSQIGLPVVYFHYRYKLAAWLLGVIERPHMRLPQLPPPVSDIETLRDALLAAGKQVAREAETLAAAAV
jgi:4-hydroxy-tetrahydrodipicolinate synthase